MVSMPQTQRHIDMSVCALYIWLHLGVINTNTRKSFLEKEEGLLGKSFEF